MQKPILSLENIYVDFERDGVISHVLDNVSLSVHTGEFISIIGHSGCGKSTLLNVVAGLVPVTMGAALLENKEITGPGPERAVVFQNHSLLPWMTVYENVKLAVNKLYGHSESMKKVHERVMNNLDLVKMTHARDKRPGEISGGMKQRVGIARALSMEPKVLLLDEPFGALDALTRGHLQDTVMELHDRIKATVLMITHDVDEAVLLADRVVMMSNGPKATIGKIVDVTSPRPRVRRDLYNDRSFMSCRQEIVSFLEEHDRVVKFEPVPA
ncbi:ABC transporter ATP-binding protein [Asticcacaulis sp. ZE23SCel15]|uniref:ABC transporter ATP-binding protein n=1 Tax=Asticcacaulis sp. ZE23SCel15 TaxID=3059027 RepID=UPI00265EEFF9|nr:ABC transporter ATP-binding protein [Asticcacaulis sp. ZE23SCel15]WKL58686.1 ABC transporter ATP-binding protein [Asticcacaulis sp. ZE23SCel15]